MHRMAADRRSVLITGCSQGGIGDALAQEFHNMGLRVLASARNLEKVQHLKEMGIEIVELDVTSTDSIKAAVEKVKDMTGGTLDILVNNAGRGRSRLLQSGSCNSAAEPPSNNYR